jgi:low temperature requirement protein LtrA
MTLTHGFVRISGRDPHERHRAATPLELLFDLTFVIAFSQAGSQAAHLFELGHTVPAVIGFAVAVFAVTWAWINFSWLASAFDTDDVFFRIATFVQMIGVAVLAIGLPPFFHSLDEGHHVDNAVMISGYVIMRLALVAIWLRVAAHSPEHRRTALAYATGVAIVQIGWVVAIVADPPLVVGLAVMVGLGVVEMIVPAVAERRGSGTPWHPHHIAERYSLLVIITLGEVILGTVLAISAVAEEFGWTFETALVAFGGMLLAFTIWWAYFTVPAARVLSRYRRRSFAWGYIHIALFGAVAGVGAGLHVAAYVISGESHVDALYALLTIAIPVLVFIVVLGVLYALLVGRFDTFHMWLLLGSVAVLAAAILASVAGASLGVTIVITALAPLVIVVGYELAGHRHLAADLARLDV